MYAAEESLAQLRLKKVKNITGQLSVMAAIVCFIYAVLFFIIDVPVLRNIEVCIMFLAIACGIASSKGHVHFARFFLVMLGNIFIFTLCGSLGRISSTNLLYIPLFCAILVLYNGVGLLFLAISTLISVAAFMVLEINDYAIFSIPMPSQYFMHITTVVSPVVSLGVAITSIYASQRAGDRAERTLVQAKEEIKKNSVVIEAKNEELEQFVYIASHDLQEPLRTITGLAEYLTDEYKDKLDGDAKRSFGYIKEASNRMTQLIKGLLDYSRLGLNPVLETIDFNQLLNAVEKDLSVRIQETATKINVEKLPVLQGYETELRLLFQNLISNAIKFSKPGEAPDIHISARRLNSEWQFAVKDNGIGIDTKYQDKIFEMFQRIHNRGEYEGSGIGLAHVKKIVSLHNGKIWFDSMPGNGTTFYFTINT